MSERPVLPKIEMDKKNVIQRVIQLQNRLNSLIAGFSLTEFNQLTYAAATSVSDELGHKPRKSSEKKKQPVWKLKIEKEIETKTEKNSESVTKLAKRGSDSYAKSQALENIKKTQESKALHGQYQPESRKQMQTMNRQTNG